MNILFIGDIFASPGRLLVARYLQEIIAEELFSLGLDVITSGNHIWDKKEIFDYLPREPRLLRPANYPADLPGSGVLVTKARNGAAVAVIDLQGRVPLPAIEDPFRMADGILKSLHPDVKVRFVDFHAELTSE